MRSLLVSLIGTSTDRMTHSVHASTVSWRLDSACMRGLDRSSRVVSPRLPVGVATVTDKERHCWGAGLMQDRTKIRSQRAGNLLRLGLLAIAFLAFPVAGKLMAQEAAGPMASDSTLPDAPDMIQPSAASSAEASSQKASSSISGTVFDSNSNVIAGARVALAGAVQREALSGSNGEFLFSDLPPGLYRLRVTSPGMGKTETSEFELLPAETRFLPRIVLPVASTAMEIRVTADPAELAEEQVHIAVEQRVLGVLPNFYSTYDWNAPALGAPQKFNLAYRSISDPVAFFGAGVLGGIEQGRGSFPGYGQGVRGYSKRFAAAYADDAIGRMLGSAILPSLFHQDPRYFYKGSGSKPSRAMYAIGAVFICRSDKGSWEPNYSHLLGSFAAGGISNLYYPAGSRGLSLTLVNGLIETAGNAGNNLLREFLFKGLTTHVPNSANGKP